MSTYACCLMIDQLIHNKPIVRIRLIEFWTYCSGTKDVHGSTKTPTQIKQIDMGHRKRVLLLKSYLR